MFPSSFRRNQQPWEKGKTLRVRAGGVSAYPEIDYARKQVISACRRSGALMAHWRRYTPEFNAGRCKVCQNPITESPVDENCPNCYGTGFDGGYSRPSIQYMVIKHSDRRLEATPQGFVRLMRATSQSPYLPNIAVGDILGEVQNMEGEWVISDRYQVEEGVDKERFHLRNEFLEPDTFDHLDPETDVVSYNFEATRIPKHPEEQMRNIKYFIPFENPVWLTTPDGGG